MPPVAAGLRTPLIFCLDISVICPFRSFANKNLLFAFRISLLLEKAFDRIDLNVFAHL